MGQAGFQFIFSFPLSSSGTRWHSWSRGTAGREGSQGDGEATLGATLGAGTQPTFSFPFPMPTSSVLSPLPLFLNPNLSTLHLLCLLLCL